MKLKIVFVMAILTAFSLTSCKNSPAVESSVEEQSVISSSVAEITQPEEKSTVSETSVEQSSDDDFFVISKIISSAEISNNVEDESSQKIEIAEYEYIKDEYNEGGIEITKYNGTDTNINIPNKIDDMEVTAIGESAFEGNERIVSVAIPNTVIDIKTNSFAQCSNLLNVTFESNSNIDGIWDGAFKETALQEFEIPENCRYILESFDFCTSMKKLTFWGKNTEIHGDFSVPLECTIYFYKGSEAEKHITLHSPFKWAYLDELE